MFIDLTETGDVSNERSGLCMTIRHVVWDWNGTLLDDYEITAQLAINSMEVLGRRGLTAEDVRRTHRRPLSDAFSALLGRTINEEELRLVHQRYVQAYEPVMFDLPLAIDAIHAIEIVSVQASQSILSMAPHDQLTALVSHHGIDSHFLLVSGDRAVARHHKREHLIDHCTELGLDPANICLIGDTVDDYVAAQSVGASAVLVTTGMQARSDLEATGAAVFDSLSKAAVHVAARISSQDRT
jgi:phosphoglycolate phosphatase-like HAD superfamily hydrolase